MGIAQVLQINVRLSEGGAAGVARNLADELALRGIKSPFAYGYGPHGGSSPIESTRDSLRLTPKTVAAINRINYSLRGKETGFISGGAARKLEAVMAQSDVVHLHVIHSYFLDTNRLFDLVARLRKPLVWTLHDHWAMTGRCAQPDACSRWTEGCYTCPTLGAYPPAKVDFAAKRWDERRESIARLQSKVPTAIVPCADWLGIDAENAGLRNVHVIKNSVDRAYWDAAQSVTARSAKQPEKNSYRNIFVCRDLRDRAKVDWQVLEGIAAIPGQQLTIVGDNAPVRIPGVEVIPATANRAQLAGLFADHDRLIFTSTVDYYPLTIAESITAGLEVYAIKSRASEEFRNSGLVHVFDNSASLLDGIKAHNERSPAAEDLIKSREFFNPDRMVSEYIELYERLG